MTIAEQLREEGRKQGLEEARQAIAEGFRQGSEQVHQRLQPTLLGLLRQRFGTAVTPAVEQRIACASFEQLETWASRVIPAATLAELLDD